MPKFPRTVSIEKGGGYFEAIKSEVKRKETSSSTLPLPQVKYLVSVWGQIQIFDHSPKFPLRRQVLSSQMHWLQNRILEKDSREPMSTDILESKLNSPSLRIETAALKKNSEISKEAVTNWSQSKLWICAVVEYYFSSGTECRTQDHRRKLLFCWDWFFGEILQNYQWFHSHRMIPRLILLVSLSKKLDYRNEFPRKACATFGSQRDGVAPAALKG